MDIILVPGLWLHGRSWDAVVPALEGAGHRVRALTLPGMDGRDDDRAGITLADHVGAVVTAIDAVDGRPLLLVGHSAGSAIGHAAVDARPDRVARAVYVGGFPSADGEPLLAGLPAQDGEVAMPDWAELGEEANVVDFDEASLARFYAEAVPAPEGVLTGTVRLSDERRWGVPVTLVCPEYTAAELRDWVAQGELPEVTRIEEVEYVDLPGGHWPQLTQPERLARVILDAAG
ncbi:alpha/beta fold hydrolase [Nocardioides euryhalodurans]|uniref:Alpha/beta fold hydrolase n=1 Tax=Nocardioides euryhalodurans TaxID=2518370 RepID=A0A4P7GNZ1_9ACTN|nr:alpha/beta fold hydrolase [Nocardioides euryhalodurans]QBR93689.1 alpha/beta fold hydrolase [Nocardioides euryhalodurans]